MTIANPEPPTTAELLLNAMEILDETWDKVDLLSVRTLRQLWNCRQRMKREQQEAFDAGFQSAGGTIVMDGEQRS